MNRDIYSQAEQLNKKYRRKRTWYKILSVPICLVVFVTTYALILPAITMESTPDTCFMNPEGEASSGETGDDVPADKPPGSIWKMSTAAHRKETPISQTPGDSDCGTVDGRTGQRNIPEPLQAGAAQHGVCPGGGRSGGSAGGYDLDACPAGAGMQLFLHG